MKCLCDDKLALLSRKRRENPGGDREVGFVEFEEFYVRGNLGAPQHARKKHRNKKKQPI